MSIELDVDVDADAVAIFIDKDAARCVGTQTALARLAREVALFAEYNDLSEPGMHAHFDPRAAAVADDALARNSCSLIVAGPVSDDA